MTSLRSSTRSSPNGIWEVSGSSPVQSRDENKIFSAVATPVSTVRQWFNVRLSLVYCTTTRNQAAAPWMLNAPANAVASRVRTPYTAQEHRPQPQRCLAWCALTQCLQLAPQLAFFAAHTVHHTSDVLECCLQLALQLSCVLALPEAPLVKRHGARL